MSLKNIRRAVQRFNPSMTPSKPPQSFQSKARKLKAALGKSIRGRIK